MKAKRGISPIIATVILIAVTIAIGIAIAGWLMGLWGGMGGAESLKLYPNATLEVASSGTKLNLTVKNEGSKDAKIIEVRIDGLGKATSCSNGASNNLPVTAKVGYMITLSCDFQQQPVPGATYTVRVMTEAGNTYLTQVTAAAAAAG
ncbi:MAG: hypothetical protein P3X22_000820 [Thermoprotei archaeon]|nr:hypothetical protein [Thermoprotei archaeon]